MDYGWVTCSIPAVRASFSNNSQTHSLSFAYLNLKSAETVDVADDDDADIVEFGSKPSAAVASVTREDIQEEDGDDYEDDFEDYDDDFEEDDEDEEEEADDDSEEDDEFADMREGRNANDDEGISDVEQGPRPLGVRPRPGKKLIFLQPLTFSLRRSCDEILRIDVHWLLHHKR